MGPLNRNNTVAAWLCFLFMGMVFAQVPKKSGQGGMPNVIVFIADDISWNDFGCYGNPFVETPHIDSLAAHGLRFNNAVLTTSSCSPSRISILTGRYPHNTGAAELHTEPKVAFGSIASELKKKGYYTGQAGKWHMGTLLRQGFDKIHDSRAENGDGGEEMWVPSILERDRGKPFFFWFAAYDAHRPWGVNRFSGTHRPEDVVVPPTLVDDGPTRGDLAKYYDEIKRFDTHIGKVITTLKKEGVYENTLLVVMADNGRPFPRDKTRLYDSGIRTPFIVHWPGRMATGTSQSLISSVDLAPTILDVCDAAIPESFQGRSFKELLFRPHTNFRRYAFAEHNWHDHEAHERMVRTTDFVYILNSRPELPNQGPADALDSPAFKSLQAKNDKGGLTKAQYDVFLAPRPKEELFYIKGDVLQVQNLIGNEEFGQVRGKLRKVLADWMRETRDNIPDGLTKDWYTRDGGKKIDGNFQIRGEMPGASTGAEKVNVISGF